MSAPWTKGGGHSGYHDQPHPPPYSAVSGFAIMRFLPTRIFSLRRLFRSNILVLALLLLLGSSYFLMPAWSGGQPAAADGPLQDTASLELVSKVSTNVHLHMGRSSDQEKLKDEMVKKYVDIIVNSPFAKPPKNYLSMCAIFRNEEDYIEEWIWYHYLVGVHHFYLYDNDSTDRTAARIRPFVNMGIVSLFRWPGPKRQAQQTHLEHCIKMNKRDESRWTAIIDIDEFITILPAEFSPEHFLTGLWGSRLHRFLSEAETLNAAVVMLYRANIGSSAHITPPIGKLTIESYNMRRMVMFAKEQDQAGKAIFMVQHLKNLTNPHRAMPVENKDTVDCIYNPWNYNNRSRVVLEPIRLNHYLTRSYSECLQKSRDPRLANMTFSWRKDLGSKLCDTYMKGQSLFKDSEHIRDEHLSASLWPRIIKAVMKHFGQWRDDLNSAAARQSLTKETAALIQQATEALAAASGGSQGFKPPSLSSASSPSTSASGAADKEPAVDSSRTITSALAPRKDVGPAAPAEIRSETNVEVDMARDLPLKADQGVTVTVESSREDALQPAGTSARQAAAAAGVKRVED
ncbi:glycosyl transferase family 2-domain-containing protein [Hyaloraphidium curvatum]|nr:glycosyl transferase family 2-domain-containing protein [Hyaloraphidium curvatum]